MYAMPQSKLSKLYKFSFLQECLLIVHISTLLIVQTTLVLNSLAFSRQLLESSELFPVILK